MWTALICSKSCKIPGGPGTGTSEVVGLDMEYVGHINALKEQKILCPPNKKILFLYIVIVIDIIPFVADFLLKKCH